MVVRQGRQGKKMERSGMRKKSRTGLFCLLAIFSIMALNSRADFSGSSLSAQEDLLVRPDETVHELLSEGGGKETVALAAGRNGLWRTGGIFVLGVGLGVFLLLSWQRRRPASAAATRARDSMEVIGRVALSSKHTACLLKVGPDRLVVVAFCGEAMSPLCTIEGEDEIGRIIGELEEPAGRAPWLTEAEKTEVADSPSEDGAVSSRSFVSSSSSARTEAGQ